MILHTTIIGEGEPLVLIHSGGLTGNTEYEEQSEFFTSRGYQVIRPDLRGHGKSVGGLDHYFCHCPQDINETLEHLNITQCHIAGVSLGGIAALLFAKAYPHKVISLAFSGIFPREPDNWAELSKAEAESHEKLLNNKEAVQYLNEIHSKNDWKSLFRFFNSKHFYPFKEIGEVSSIKIPTICIYGEKQAIEVSAAMMYKELNQKFNISIIPFAGHLVHRDQPELYSETLYTFLKNI